ncbi:hypothetical protein [Burkholderia gladioli]|uniref:hypothetical protein n=1 Tax=Burkholderia gladioli TaxID=28095 RepID=UPI001641D12A|nr:hypothetical protein [Burkholderia gladioli]
MTQPDLQADLDSLGKPSPLRKMVYSDIQEAISNRLLPFSGSSGNNAKWLPDVLKSNNLSFTIQINERFVAAFIERTDVLKKLKKEWARSATSEYPGAFENNPYNSIFQISESEKIIFEKFTLTDGGIFLDKNSSIILHEVGIKRSKNSKPYDYSISLCYAFSFGDKIRPLSSGSHMDALVSYSLANWRRDATAR